MSDADVCPICECPFEQSVTTVFGGSITHSKAKQARTCFDGIEDVSSAGHGPDQKVSAVRLYYHSAEQIMEEDAGRSDDERVELTDASK